MLSAAGDTSVVFHISTHQVVSEVDHCYSYALQYLEYKIKFGGFTEHEFCSCYCIACASQFCDFRFVRQQQTHQRLFAR